MRVNKAQGDVLWVPAVFAVFVIGVGIALGFLIPNVDNPLKATLLTVGLIGAVVTLFRPDVGLYGLVLMAYLRISDIAIDYYGAPSVFKPFIALLVVAVLVQWLRAGEIKKGWGLAALLVGAYGLVVFSSLLYASDYATAASTVSDFAKNGIVTLLLVVLIQSPTRFRGVIWTLVAAGIFTGSISVFQYFTGTFTHTYGGFGQAQIQNIVTGTDDYRISGPIGDPNFYAQILVVIVPLAFHLMLAEKNLFRKGLAAWCTAVCSLAIIFTFSRGGAVALGVVLACLLVYHRPKPIEWVALIGLVVVLLVFLPNLYGQRITSMTRVLTGETDVREEASLRGRMSELLVAWQMFLDHPVLGVGVGNYPVNYQSYSRMIGLDPRIENREPHNLFLEVAAETGLVGLVVFLAVVYLSFRSVFRAWRDFKRLGDGQDADLAAVVGIGMLGYFTAALFIHGAYPRYLWVLVGLALALPQVVRAVRAELNVEEHGR